MTHTELYKMLKTTDLPVAYRYFKEPPTPPYIVYLETDGAGWGSDARNEIRRTGYLVELYSTKKEIDVQSRLETLF